MAIDIMYCAREFYILEAMNALKSIEPFKKSHEKWLKDFTEYRNLFIDKLAAAIYDYTVLAVAGEMRHAYSRCEMYNPHVPYASYRGQAYRNALAYDPRSILQAACSLFGQHDDWEEGYGGYNWQKIAEAGLMYGKLPNVVFVDHCLDLSHNNGTYFDKEETNLFCSDYKTTYARFMDKKAEMDPQELIRYILFGMPVDYTVSQKVLTLLSRALNLGIIDLGFDNMCRESFLELLESASSENLWFILDYQPKIWGDKVLPDVVIDNPNCACEEEEEDSDYDDDEENEEDSCDEDGEETEGGEVDNNEGWYDTGDKFRIDDEEINQQNNRAA